MVLGVQLSEGTGGGPESTAAFELVSADRWVTAASQVAIAANELTIAKTSYLREKPGKWCVWDKEPFLQGWCLLQARASTSSTACKGGWLTVVPAIQVSTASSLSSKLQSVFPEQAEQCPPRTSASAGDKADKPSILSLQKSKQTQFSWMPLCAGEVLVWEVHITQDCCWRTGVSLTIDMMLHHFY